MKLKRRGLRRMKATPMSNPVQQYGKPLMNPKKEMQQKTMKMKVGSAASKVRFIGWRIWSRNGKSWAQNLSSVHQSTWKNAGIYDAIMASKYPIKRHDNLILELASRWCSNTSSFIFPWGEATITLEDVMVLGGFSALGVTTLSPPENDAELLEIEERLELARKEVQRGKSRKASQSQWMMRFIGTKSDLEHDAFLMFWLSRFVFPAGPSNIINRHIFHIGIQLSRGIKFALARPVLAMLYKELTALNKMLVDMASVSDTGRGSNNVQLNVFAPFHIVQIWAWERLPLLKPEMNCMYCSGELPRVARWSNVKILKDKDLSSAIDLAEESFVWCPYGEFDKHRGREAQESLVRCVKSSKLEGFDCVEKYLPQRVARQFGLVQDIPTDHGDELTKQVTFKDDKLYATSRRAKATVTACYQQWWKQQRSPPSSSQVKVENGIDYGPPPGFPPRIQFIIIDDSESDDDGDFDDEEDTLPSAYTSMHVPATQIGSESTFSFSSSNSDNESIEGDENLSHNGDKVEESGKANMQPASISKTVHIKREDSEEQEHVPSGFTCQVITIDDSSEDDNETEHPFAQSELSKHKHSRDTEAGRGLDFMNKPTKRAMRYACKHCTGSKQDSRDGTEAIAPSLHEAASTVPHNELATNFDAESFTNERTSNSNLNLEARISKLEKIVFAHIDFGA